MRIRHKLAAAAALMAAAQIASAGIARAELTDLSMSWSGGQWWVAVFKDVTWLPLDASTLVSLDTQDASLSDSKTGWHGNAQDTSVANDGLMAHAGMTAAKSGAVNGVSAVAEVTVGNGKSSGWAADNLFNGKILVGGGTTVTLTATLGDFFVDADQGQANFTMQICSFDCDSDADNNLIATAEAFVDETGPYGGKKVLKTTWTNPGDTTWASMRINLNASAMSVPEPTSIAVALTGLALVGLSRRRGRR